MCETSKKMGEEVRSYCGFVKMEENVSNQANVLRENLKLYIESPLNQRGRITIEKRLENCKNGIEEFKNKHEEALKSKIEKLESEINEMLKVHEKNKKPIVYAVKKIKQKITSDIM